MEVGGTFEVAVLTRQGRQCGLTQCFERTAIQTGGSKAMPGWTPRTPTLTVNERRRAHRVPVGFPISRSRAAIIGSVQRSHRSPVSHGSQHRWTATSIAAVAGLVCMPVRPWISNFICRNPSARCLFRFDWPVFGRAIRSRSGGSVSPSRRRSMAWPNSCEASRSVVLVVDVPSP